MLPSIAGAINMGHFDANTVVVRESSDIPFDILEMVLAVAGAITIMSADSANPTWLIANSELISYILVTTSLWVIDLNAKGVKNS